MKQNSNIYFVCSSGGHLKQLQAIKSGLTVKPHFFISTTEVEDTEAETHNVVFQDCSLKTPLLLAVCTLQTLRFMLKHRPSLVVSTGAAPGGIAIFLAKRIFKSKTIWIDSMANTKVPSKTGKLVKRYCDVWISQWQDIAISQSGTYIGKIYDIFNSRDSA